MRNLALGSAHDAPQGAHARDCEVLLLAAVLKSRTRSERGEGSSQ